MNILQVTNFFKPSWEAGGPPRVAYEVSKTLVSRDYNVTVYTCDGFKNRLLIKKNKPVNVDGIKTYYFKNLSIYLSKKFVFPIPYYLPIIARRDVKNYDIIHIHEHRTFIAAVVYYYARKHSIPYVLHAHGSVLPFFQKQKIKEFFDLIVGNRILKEASKVIALTDVERDQFIKMGIDESQIEIVPNGIDPLVYNNLPDRGGFRSKYGISKNEKIVLYLGRIHKIKGIDLLVETFSDLVHEIEEIKLVIAGPDDGFLSTLKLKVEKLNIGHKVIFTGSLYDTDKFEAYVDADVYVLPSIYEVFGVTLLEACACGTPVITTDQCGISNVVKEVGYVVGYDKSQLHDAIFEILSDDDLRWRLGEKGRELVKEEFCWDEIVKNVEEIYISTIENKKTQHYSRIFPS